MLSEKPSAEHHREGADQRHRDGDERDDRRAPRLEEDDHHHDDQEDGLEQRHHDRADRLANVNRRVVDDAILDAFGKRLLEALHYLTHLRRRLDRVRAGTLGDADRDRLLVVEQAAQRIEVRAELDPGDVAEPRDLSLRRRPHDDGGELLFRVQPPLRVDRQLERRVGRARRRAEHAGRDLDVLFANRADDVGGGELPRRQLVRIDPDPHAVLAGAEDLHAADARDLGELVLHLEVGEVRQIEHVVAVVRRDEMRDQQEVGRRLLRRHADALDVGRQARQRLRDPVLHLDLGVVEVGAERERHRQLQPAVGGRLREHVEQALDAAELLLERRRDGLGDDLRVGAGIDTADDDGWRDDAGVFADRQPEERQRPANHDQEREHRGKDRTFDEELREPHASLTSLPAWRRRPRWPR